MHVFYYQHCRAGLNFADESEAMRFKSVVEEKVRSRQDKRVGE